MPKLPEGPDVRQLSKEPLPKLTFPGGRSQDFRIFIAPEVHAEIWKHGTEDASVEICGVLVGQWNTDADGPFAHVSASIRGEAATSKFAEVTFTHETWSKINAEMDSKYAKLTIVGWYHTHPNFGIFLSDRDRFIQENFFSSPGQMALVVDPIQKIEGVFIWRHGKTELVPYYWVGNRLLTGPAPAADGADKHPGPMPSLANSPEARSEGSSRTPAYLPSLFLVGLQYLLVFLLGFLLAGNWRSTTTLRLRQEAVAFACLQLGLKPGLQEYLAALRKELNSVSSRLEKLSATHQDLLAKQPEVKPEQVAEVRDAWRNLKMRTSESAQFVDRIETLYCLTPGEQARYFEFLVAASGPSSAGGQAKPPEKPGTPPEAGAADPSSAGRASPGQKSSPRDGPAEKKSLKR